MRSSSIAGEHGAAGPGYTKKKNTHTHLLRNILSLGIGCRPCDASWSLLGVTGPHYEWLLPDEADHSNLSIRAILLPLVNDQ